MGKSLLLDHSGYSLLCWCLAMVRDFAIAFSTLLHLTPFKPNQTHSIYFEPSLMPCAMIMPNMPYSWNERAVRSWKLLSPHLLNEFSRSDLSDWVFVKSPLNLPEDPAVCRCHLFSGVLCIRFCLTSNERALISTDVLFTVLCLAFWTRFSWYHRRFWISMETA